MMTSDDKVGGWVKKGQNHDDVILECPLSKSIVLGPNGKAYSHFDLQEVKTVNICWSIM